MKLEPNDLLSAAVKKLITHYDERLEVLRKQNDGDLDERSTIRLRGRIAEIKALLSILEPDKAIPGAE